MSFKKTSSFVVIAVILIFLILLYILASNSNSEVGMGNNCFNVELAKTPEELSRGLMYLSSLDVDSGMLFIFKNEGKHPFWMKNTLIPLDIIWISKDKGIIHISKNTPPCSTGPCQSYSPENEALYVLEVNAGLSDKYGFKEGDKVEFNNIDL